MIYFHIIRGDIAKSVRHQTLTLAFVGSSPAIPAKKNRTVKDCPVFFIQSEGLVGTPRKRYVTAVRRMLSFFKSFLRIDYIHFLAKMITFRLRRITCKANIISLRQRHNTTFAKAKILCRARRGLSHLLCLS